MPSFKFSLQAVLDARHSKVEALEIQLGQLNQQLLHLQEMLQTLEDLLARLFNELQREKQADEMDLFNVINLHQNIDFTQVNIEDTLEALRILEEQIEAKRQELVLARQEEEVMEILKEKEYQKLLDAIAAAESKMLDDIYVARAFRMSKENPQSKNS